LYKDHISIVGIYVGTEEECRNSLELPPDFPHPNCINVVHHEYQEDAEYAAWGGSEKHTSGVSWYIQSCVIPNKLQDSTIRTIVQEISKMKATNFRTVLEWVPLGGNVKPNKNNSFRFYDCAAIVQVISKWDQPGKLLAAEVFTDTIYKLLYMELGKDTYLGFPDSRLSSVNYYGRGAHLLRLKNMKCYEDPCNIFRSPQSIDIC
jgi:hypothetical protein